jgi:S-adenosylmethionine:tRNA ribosyltransferase-isomerase
MLNNYSLSDFDFSLPIDLIASHPSNPRDASKLVVFDSNAEDLIFDVFANVFKFLPRKSVLIFNDTKVFKARLKVKNFEIFFLRKNDDNTYNVLVFPGKKFQIGNKFDLPDQFELIVERVHEDGTRDVRIDPNQNFDMIKYLDKHGQVPIPPYIKAQDPSIFETDYQTVYAREFGSVAAPTAGLHFTPELMSFLESNGVKLEFITLNVGLGTFQPIKTENLNEVKLHSESFNFPFDVAKRLNDYIEQDFSLIAVGTTVLRTLQSCWNSKSHSFISAQRSTDLFISPGFSDWAVKGLITNFHLPKSSLFILISAFIGLDNAKKVYQAAIGERMRFFSFGDACLFLR